MVKHFIYDKNGRPIAILYSNGDIIDLNGYHIAFIHKNSIYDYNGYHRGWYASGIFRDPFGDTTCFLKGASDTPKPLLPLTALKPLAPLKHLRPLRPLRALAPLKPLKSMKWSRYSLFELIGI